VPLPHQQNEEEENKVRPGKLKLRYVTEGTKKQGTQLFKKYILSKQTNKLIYSPKLRRARERFFKDLYFYFRHKFTTVVI